VPFKAGLTVYMKTF